VGRAKRRGVTSGRIWGGRRSDTVFGDPAMRGSVQLAPPTTGTEQCSGRNLNAGSLIEYSKRFAAERKESEGSRMGMKEEGQQR